MLHVWANARVGIERLEVFVGLVRVFVGLGRVFVPHNKVPGVNVQGTTCMQRHRTTMHLRPPKT